MIRINEGISGDRVAVSSGGGKSLVKTKVTKGVAVSYEVERPRTLFGYLLEKGISKAEWARMRVDKDTALECERIEMELQDDMVANALIGNYDSTLVAKILGIGQQEQVVTPAININLQVNGKDLPKRLEIG